MQKKLAKLPELQNQSIKAFLAELGSSSVSPGGGSAAALSAALGAALSEMTARLNQKRLKTKSQDPSKRIAALQAIRRKLAKVITEDVKAFKKISKLYQKKGSPELEKALQNGALVPMSICRLSVEAAAISIAEIDRTSKWLASDLAEAGLLLRAAFYSARFNVEINLKGIQEESFKKSISKEIEDLALQIDAHQNSLHFVLSR